MDGIYYTHFSLIDPLLTVLHNVFPHLEFKIECESTHFTEIESQELFITAKSRLDILIWARWLPLPWKPTLLYEAKQPGTIDPSEWDAALGPRCGLKGNAELLGEQGRKYLSAINHHSVIF